MSLQDSRNDTNVPLMNLQDPQVIRQDPPSDYARSFIESLQDPYNKRKEFSKMPAVSESTRYTTAALQKFRCDSE